MQYAYPCLLTPEEDGRGFAVSFPDVPEALTCGRDRAQALAMAEDALAVALGMYMHNREDIPLPSPVARGQELVAVPSIVAAKLALYVALRQQGVTEIALADHLGLSEGAIRTLLNPDRRSSIHQVEKALRAVGRILIVEDRAA